MEDKRKNPRMEISLELSVSSLFKQDNDSIDIDSPIKITDISKGGIGFTCQSFLPIGYYFNAALQMGNQSSRLYCVVRIIRNQLISDAYHYGCEFVGMAPILDFIFDEYADEIHFSN